MNLIHDGKTRIAVTVGACLCGALLSLYLLAAYLEPGNESPSPKAEKQTTASAQDKALEPATKSEAADDSGYASAHLAASLPRQQSFSSAARTVESTTAATSNRPDPAIVAEEQGPYSLPLLMRSIDLSSLPLTEEQVNGISKLRNDFVDAVGGPNQDPAAPGYARRWAWAHYEFDEQLMIMLGTEMFNQLQIAAMQPANPYPIN